MLGASATLSGSTTDGPEQRGIRVRASHGSNATAALIQITVRNVPPSISTVSKRDVLGQQIGTDVPFLLAGLPLQLQAAFTDPGQSDWQIASITWGDGSISHDGDFDTFRDGYGSGVGSLIETHRYSAPGDYVVTVRVEDDDGGSATTSSAVNVVTTETAVVTVIEAIDAIVAGEPAAVAEALDEVRRALDGSNGAASNGAIDKLDDGSVQAALVKLASALDGLAASEEAGAGDLMALENLLTMVMQQLEMTGG